LSEPATRQQVVPMASDKVRVDAVASDAVQRPVSAVGLMR
jgi:hypothetical protein